MLPQFEPISATAWSYSHCLFDVHLSHGAKSIWATIANLKPPLLTKKATTAGSLYLSYLFLFIFNLICGSCGCGFVMGIWLEFNWFVLSCILGCGGCGGCWLVATGCGSGCWSLGGGHCHYLCFAYWLSFVLIHYFNVLYILYYFMELKNKTCEVGYTVKWCVKMIK